MAVHMVLIKYIVTRVGPALTGTRLFSRVTSTHGVTVRTLVTTLLYGPVKVALNVMFEVTTGVTIGNLIHELPVGISSCAGTDT